MGIHRISTLKNQGNPMESNGIHGNPWIPWTLKLILLEDLHTESMESCGFHWIPWKIPSENMVMKSCLDSVEFHGIPKSIWIPSGCVWNSKVLSNYWVSI